MKNIISANDLPERCLSKLYFNPKYDTLWVESLDQLLEIQYDASNSLDFGEIESLAMEESGFGWEDADMDNITLLDYYSLKELILIVARDEGVDFKRPELKLLTPELLPWMKDTLGLGPGHTTTWADMEVRAAERVALRIKQRDAAREKFWGRK